MLPGGTQVAAFVAMLQHEPTAHCLVWAIGRLIRKNPIYVATLFEHSLYADEANDGFLSDEALLGALRDRLERIERDAAWRLEHGYRPPSTTTTTRRTDR